MKNNHVLRIMRASEENTCTQEFVDYTMRAEIRFSSYVYFVKEISIFVYDAHRQLAGKSTLQVRKNQKKVKVCQFEIATDHVWEEGRYMVHIMCNGIYRWLAEINIGDECCDGGSYARAEMKNFSEYGAEKLFAEELRHKSWWTRLKSERVSTRLAGELVEKLYIQRCLVEDGACSQTPHMIVSGKKYDAIFFAMFILSAYVTDDNIKARFRLSLDDLIHGIVSLDELTVQIQTHKVVAMAITKAEYNDNLVSKLDELTGIINNGDFNNSTFIFYGETENIVDFRSNCKAIDELFGDANTFCTTDSETYADSVEDEDFKLFEETFEEYKSDCTHEIKEENVDNGMHAETELQKLIGLEKLKNEIHEARMQALFQKERRMLCLESLTDNRHHMLFMGGPGTGKTTVARLVGKMYHSMGLLSKGHTVETDRTKLLGKFIGHTEDNMKEIIEKARGGVLFIDEAYTLIDSGDDSNDFGKEVLNSLLTVLSEPNPDMIVILAGYEDKMMNLLKFNQGLKDRFPFCFRFENYTKQELMEICHAILKERNFILTKEAERRIESIIDKAVAQRDRYFGNGRWIHNLIEHGVIKSMAKRVMSTPHNPYDSHLLCTIEESDVIDTELNYIGCSTVSIAPPRHIGFTA